MSQLRSHLMLALIDNVFGHVFHVYPVCACNVLCPSFSDKRVRSTEVCVQNIDTLFVAYMYFTLFTVSCRHLDSMHMLMCVDTRVMSRF